jgi:hypothetical protein
MNTTYWKLNIWNDCTLYVKDEPHITSDGSIRHDRFRFWVRDDPEATWHVSFEILYNTLAESEHQDQHNRKMDPITKETFHLALLGALSLV